MNRYLLRFEKMGQLRYTSHLDIMRLFKRNFKRAGINLVHSQGFNPHPKISFALPLSLGHESKEEYMEIETQQPYNPDIIMNLLNDNLPRGIKITGCKAMSAEKNKLAASVEYAAYEVVLNPEIRFSKDEILRDFLNQNNIIAEKRVKKKLAKAPVDIKPLIESLDLIKRDNGYIITMLVKAGSRGNLNPELLLEAVFKYDGLNVSKGDYQIIRTKLLDRGKNPFL